MHLASVASRTKVLPKKIALDDVCCTPYNFRKGDDPVKTTAITFRMDEELKKQPEETLDNIGLTMSAAFTVFAKAIVRTGTIPFELAVDPFYRADSQKELSRRIELYESGETKEQQVVVTIKELEALTNA